jgi:hypothetical protein
LLAIHGYIGTNRNRGSWPRNLVMFNKNSRKRDQPIVFDGFFFRNEDAARRDGKANALFIANKNASDVAIGGTPMDIRAISWHWLSARYFKTAEARRCVLGS